MPATTALAQLLATPTSAQNLASLLALLQLGGFPATAWQSGSAGPVLTQMDATALTSLGTAIAQIAAGGVLATPGNPASGAAGGWLDLLGTQIFQDARKGATFTQGSVVLTDAAHAGPFTIVANGLWVSDPSKTYSFNSTNATSLTLPLGGTLTVPVQAAVAGAAYNLANAGISIVTTSLPGVTVSNPSIGTTGSWITQAGTDAELDPAYTARLAAKWATLGSGSNAAAYLYNATTASVTGTSEVTQATVSAAGGIVTVAVAGPTGPISAAALVLVDTAIQAKRPLTVQVVTVNATPSQTAIAGNVFVKSSADLAATLSAVRVALSRLFQSVAIGGTLYTAQIIATVMGVPGVYDVTLTAPAADVVLGASTVATPIFLLTASR